MAIYDGDKMKPKFNWKMWIYPMAALVVLVGVIIIVMRMSPIEKPERDEVKSPAEVNKPASPVVVDANAAMTKLTDVNGPNMPTGMTAQEAGKLIAEAQQYLNAQPQKVIEARTALNKALALPLSGEQKMWVKDQMTKLADKWLFGKTIYPGDTLCSAYKIKPGDLLSTIGKGHKVPYEILMELNGISKPEALKANATLKIPNGPFNAKIYRSTYTMDLYLQNVYVKSFKVGLGKQGHSTPTGLWVVKKDGKMIQPKWTDPDTGKVYKASDPDYPLGSRWIGLDGVDGNAKGRTGFAIHGTKDPQEIGTAASRGCVRLFNGDAILVYNLMMPGLSQVKIVD